MINQKTEKTILIDKNINLIQELRVIQAISESDYSISINNNQKIKFSLLKLKFGMKYEIGIMNGLNVSEIVEINHSHPFTKIGSLSRVLIFPHCITSYCKTLWSNDRKYKFTFTGLITNERQRILKKWIKSNFKCTYPKIPITNKRFYRIKMKLLGAFCIQDFFAKQYGDFFIWSSNRGRVYPQKSWDEDYYKILSNSKFVLCPSGDYIWSYRFFESILCGAIPIVEKSCAAYEGFRFKNMTDDPNDFLWTMEDAKFNYKLCVEKITIPNFELNNELDNLFSRIERRSPNKTKLMIKKIDVKYN
jgi:hypothetical protein